MSFDYQPVLKGELVELRPLRAADYDALYAVAADPRIWEQHPDTNRHEPAVFREFFYDSLASGGALIAMDTETGQVIGSSRFYGYDEERSEIEIGWSFLARSYWGGAYNGEMKRLMLAHAFRFVNTVVLFISPDNIRSQRATEKIGGVRSVAFVWNRIPNMRGGTSMCMPSRPRALSYLDDTFTRTKLSEKAVMG